MTRASTSSPPPEPHPDDERGVPQQGNQLVTAARGVVTPVYQWRLAMAKGGKAKQFHVMAKNRRVLSISTPRPMSLSEILDVITRARD